MVWISDSAEARGINVTDTYTAIVVELLRITNRAAASVWVPGYPRKTASSSQKYIPMNTAANPQRKAFSSKSGMDLSKAWTPQFRSAVQKYCRETRHLYLSPWTPTPPLAAGSLVKSLSPSLFFILGVHLSSNSQSTIHIGRSCRLCCYHSA